MNRISDICRYIIRMDTCQILQNHANRSTGLEKTLALVASRWIAAEPEAVGDPLLSELLKRAEIAPDCSYTGTSSFDNLMCRGPQTSRIRLGGATTLLDYFQTTPASSASPASPSSSFFFSSSSSSAKSERLQIFCDGACTANGRRGAAAGFGVSVQKEGAESLAISEPLEIDEQHTNQRAELHGLYKALQIAMESKEGADIYTDSRYAMDCLIKWCPGWVASGWKKVDKKPVLHQDLLKPMWELWKQRGSKASIFHVSAHTGGRDVLSKGNARADELAQGAAVKAGILLSR